MDEVGEKTKPLMEFDAKATKARETIDNRNLNTKPSWRLRLAKAFGIGAVGVLAATNPMVQNTAENTMEKASTAQDHILNAKDEVVDKTTTGLSHIEEAKNDVVDKATTVGDKFTTAYEHTESAIVAPIEGTKDKLADIFGQEDPKPREPDEIFVGKVTISTNGELSLRKSPMIPGAHEPDNKSDWNHVKLANKVTKDGITTYEPIDFKKGDTILAENPEIALGQNTDGGAQKDGKWIELTVLDEDGNPHARYVNFQTLTDEFVQIVSSENSFIQAGKTLQDANGVTLSIHSEPLPSVIGNLSIQNHQQ